MRNAAKSFLVAWLLGAVLWNPGRVLAQYEPGKGIYNNKCAICHGQDGKGNGPLAASFSPSPADLTNPNIWQGNFNQRITDTIENGHGPMPAINLNSSEIRAVIDYMSHAFKP